MSRVRFLPAAEAELLREVAFYSEARDGYGVRFETAVEAAVAMAQDHPYCGSPTKKGARSLVVQGFPFSVIYRAGPTELLIVAIAHHKRLPDYWSRRLR